jgi:glycosyltransferase involved in cell wall biosynthesis
VKDPVTSPRSSAPDISVIVPVRDEEASIRVLLEGLLAQTLPPKEIVITDGGSVDATRDIVEEFIKDGAPVRLIRERDSLPGRARNIAAKNSRYQWIAFTDAGTRSAPDWLACLAEKVGDGSDVDVVYGSYEPVADSFFKECAAIAYVPPAVETDGGFVRPRSIVSALMRRQAWEDVGGFPEHLRSAEDLLFMNKVEQAGFRIVRAPQALVYWTIQPGPWSTFRRFSLYARNNIRAGLWRQWQAAIFQLYALIILVAVPAVFVGVKWLIVPLLLWLALMIARAAQAVFQNRRAYPAGFFRNSLRLLLIVPIIATLDAAAFAGTISWLLRDKLRLASMKHVRHDDDSGE